MSIRGRLAGDDVSTLSAVWGGEVVVCTVWVDNVLFEESIISRYTYIATMLSTYIHVLYCEVHFFRPLMSSYLSQSSQGTILES